MKFFAKKFIEMTRFCKRYVCCAIILLILVFFVYYRFFGRFHIDRIIVSSDEFIAIAYAVEEDDEINRQANNDQHLLNLTDFQYKLQPTDDVCDINTGESLLAILIVTSYVGHDDLRSAHRMAISKVELAKANIVRAFLLAEIPEKEKFIKQEAIENEHRHFNDIVQGNFIEAYRNLPYKHVMGLRWASFHKCLRPTFIIKMDDDIVVDFSQLIEYLSTQKQQQLAKNDDDIHFLAGYIFRHVQPIRKRQNKWFVSEDEFSGNEYPDYLSGWMYVTIPKTARALVLAASQPFTRIFWIDDTWITGILREKRLIPIDDSLNERFSANSQFLDCCIADMQKHKYKCPFLAGPNGADSALIKKYNEAVRQHCLRHENSDANDDDDNKQMGQNICIDRQPNYPSIKDTCVGSDKHLLNENHGAAVISAFRL